MSEYQFYEFKAIDRPLSAADRQYVQSLSSRAKVTATGAEFVYNYGDFRGDPKKVLDRCFDMMVYVANFGVRCLMIRFPKNLIQVNVLAPYCVKHCISVSTTTTSIILQMNLNAEAYYSWLDEDTYLDALLPLREDILKGDYRVLYLAWLAAGFTEDISAEPEEMVEPPVPANLHKLLPPLKALAEFWQIDQDLITAAALTSPQEKMIAEPVAEWIAALPESDRLNYLCRVAQGESHVGAELMQRLRQEFGGVTTGIAIARASSQRTLAELIEIAYNQRELRTAKAKKAAETARKKHLEKIAPNAGELWSTVSELIELKKAQPYDEAVRHLVDLRDLAISQKKLRAFQIKMQKIQEQYSSRSGLLNRLRAAQLIP
jgi:hypothetical protein